MASQNFNPVHSEMLFLQRFFCRPLLFPPCTIPCKIVLASPAYLDTFPTHFFLRFFTVVKTLSQGPMACLILWPHLWWCRLCNLWDSKQFPKAFQWTAISSGCPLSQAYHSTEITRERISLIFELRDIRLSFQMVFSLVSAAFVYAILNSTSRLEPWSATTAPRYSKLSTSSNFSPMILMSMLMLFVLLVISLVFFLLISTPKAAEVLSRRSTREASSSSFPAKPSMSSAKR